VGIPVVYVAGKDPLWELGGGHSSYVRAHARAAIRAGFEPHLVCVSDRTATATREYGVIHQLAAPTVRYLGLRARGATLTVPLLARAVERLVRRLPDPVPIHGFAYWGAAGVDAARRLGHPGAPPGVAVSMYTTVRHEYAAIVAGCRAAPPPRRLLRERLVAAWTTRELAGPERRACEGARTVLVNYEAVRTLLRQAYPRCAPVTVLPHAPESAFTDPGAPARPPGVPPHVVSVARHDPRKRLDLLIRALGDLHRRGEAFRATLVGGGPLLEAHRRLVETLGLSGLVAVPGEVPDSGLVLRRADLFVLPTAEEGGGALALLEAFQAGVAVVATAVDGLTEDVVDGVSGLLVPPGDPGRLAQAVARLLREPVLRARLAAEGRATFERRFSGAALAAALAGLYDRLVRP
jgi:glycosyltransferase involved in cell wall biosynthesis